MSRSLPARMLGGLWLLDGVLQLQPFMFGRGCADEILRGAGDGQSVIVRLPVDAIAGVVGHLPVLTNLAFALTQLLLGVVLLARPRSRAALAASAVWGLLVWWLGEGLGGLFTGDSMLATGAPGAALLYAVVSVLLWRRETRPASMRLAATAVWVAVWVGGALLQLLPGRSNGQAIGSALTSSADDAPALLHHALSAAGAAVPNGFGFALALALVQALVGLLVLARGRSALLAVSLGCALDGVFFVFGQSAGGLTTGRATDPGTAPVVVVLGLCVLTAIRSRPASEDPPANPDPVGGNIMLSKAVAAKAAVGAVALAVTATACGGSSGGSSAGSPSTAAPSTSMSMPSGAASSTDATATKAAALRAGLDQLFREHVDLTGFTVQTAVTAGVTSPQTAAALKALDGNTVALADAVGSIYGASARTAFLSMWRAHINFFVDYTVGLATKNNAKVADAQKKLAGYKADFAKFLGGATQIPPAAIATELQGHIQTLEAAIQAIVAKSATAGAKLQMAAMHMDGTAAALAGGIAKEKSLDGDAAGNASALRAALTGLLIQHVAQTGQVVQTAVATGLTSAQTKGAVAALDANTVDLGNAIGSLYGASAQSAFLTMWRAHIGFFVNYTKGLAAKDSALVSRAQTELAGYQKQFGTFLGTAVGLPGAAVSADLAGHIQTLEAAIQAIVSGSPTAAAKIAMAEDHMAGTAAVLARAIAAQKHLS